ncbi:monoamine oxidase b, putative [Ichthyophthirius multifiliis]|uniref:monoamine oxidase n=1 Tax=Ichthyophthirius multifiliis TaxID=5932 RepID=G0QRL7_ICHMU|nr:monoamine oxidase b, putative [Ichthyophthirius multifiliis]EGR32138.1 monoamine oxidase b, putative [Ichthyophthirius multifiliis]|eukprot:XP_004035624.1 monoamine oxidase b, putative [Ichthyophthirius multifiliis]
MQDQKTQKYSVIIIGGGLSGLAALKRLVDKGQKDILLLESNEKVGGRVHTYTKNNLYLDKGASWVCPQQNRILELLKEYQIETIEQYTAGKNILKYIGKENTGDEQILICQQVIVCIPPQSLNGKVQFTNILDKKREQIQTVKIGELIKCYLVFKSPFWRKKGFSGLIFNIIKQPCLYYDLSNDQYGILLAFYQQGRENTNEKFLQKSLKERENIILKDCMEYFDINTIQEEFLFYSDDNFIGKEGINGCPVGVAGVDYWKQFGDVWNVQYKGIFWASTECSIIWNGYMEGAVRAGEKAANDILGSL